MPCTSWARAGGLDVLEVGGHGLGDSNPRTVAVFLNGFDPGTVGFEFEGFATRAVNDLRAVFDLLALSSALPPLDVVVALGMKLDFAAHPNLIAEFTVRLHDGGVQVPVFAHFDFF